ncbi:hypothetical protein HMPREF2772_27210 [Achromobacter xylosoxidans]|uniref:hypothetical protein n=1 Tax=Alcaligenes xylosoxydans xylosoxydans TaxID=85698 RepID=UPI0008A3BCEC|nr:hypothetical protein [Achromobacter xylosoxidans]OFL37495.1 hypothetical protein HMPREF2772_27210 [Achromobacter xylosoxidans]
MDYPDEFKTKTDIQAHQRHQQRVRDVPKVAQPKGTDAGAAAAMVQYGGSFMRLVGLAWQAADPMNQARLKEAFRPEFDRYRKDAATLAHYQGLAIEAELAGRN